MFGEEENRTFLNLAESGKVQFWRKMVVPILQPWVEL